MYLNFLNKINIFHILSVIFLDPLTASFYQEKELTLTHIRRLVFFVVSCFEKLTSTFLNHNDYLTTNKQNAYVK